LRVLFICSRNRRRSPTAEQVFANYPRVETASAGLAPDADERVGVDHIEWADLIFVMEPIHKRRLLRDLPTAGRKRVIDLNIRDQYDFMEPALVDLLNVRVTPFLGR
jgi:predicted protein tyrosine phosphatase